MKLVVSYPTTERKYVSAHSYTLVHKTVELMAVRVIRHAMGRVGAAANRYWYQAQFVAPEDAAFICNGLITENISRPLNKHFKPKELSFINNKVQFDLTEPHIQS